MTAGWGETEVLMDVSSRRLARVLHRLLAEHGLLSFLSLLRAFRLHVIKRNQVIFFLRTLTLVVDNSAGWHLETNSFHQHVRLI